MKEIFKMLLETVNEIDQKIVEDFDDPKIEITAEMIDFVDRAEHVVYLLKTFKDMAEVYAAQHS